MFDEVNSLVLRARVARNVNELSIGSYELALEAMRRFRDELANT